MLLLLVVCGVQLEQAVVDRGVTLELEYQQEWGYVDQVVRDVVRLVGAEGEWEDWLARTCVHLSRMEQTCWNSSSQTTVPSNLPRSYVAHLWLAAVM